MKLKHFIITVALVGSGIMSAFAQRIAYVDSEYILTNMPEYNAAQKQLEDQSEKWQKEVDARYAEIEKMYRAYQDEQAMLSDEMRKRREDEIVQKERETKEYQRKIFGMEGDLFNERKRLMEPIQEKVTNAIQTISQRQNLDLILDKGSEATFLYANPQLDKSKDVLAQLGYKP